MTGEVRLPIVPIARNAAWVSQPASWLSPAGRITFLKTVARVVIHQAILSQRARR